MGPQLSKVDGAGHGYPRPQFARSDWVCLNGPWQFVIDHGAAVRFPKHVTFGDTTIVVPFAPETPASGVSDTSFYKAVWYRRTVDAPDLKPGERLILHFGAVDWSARVWVNDQFVVEHEGGYTPFSADITDHVEPGKQFVVSVRAEDNPHDLEKNRGKQDWEEVPHGIWYPRTTGIWQTVWMEVVPNTSLQSVTWRPSIDHFTVDLALRLDGPLNERMRVFIKLAVGADVLADVSYALTTRDVRNGEMKRTIQLSELSELSDLPDGTIDRIRERYFWHPNHPNLIDAILKLRDEGGAVIDTVRSYTQLVKAETRGDRIFVNNCGDRLRLVLDQGYWASSGMTPPDDAAIQEDIRLIKEAGFNGVRKHNKLEDPRFLYWADRLGLFVWEELPSAYHFTDKSMARSIRCWTEAIERDRNHGCIIAWVPINESWGVLQLPESSLQREYQRSMYRLTRSLTGGAVVVGNDGWEMVESDIVAIHDYDADTARIARRYAPENLERLFREEKPGGRVLLLDGMTYQGKPILLTEFGGIKLSKETGSWGYSEAKTPEELACRYGELMAVVHALPVLGGFCYTEFTDVYQEANGLFWMDRTPKFSLEVMRKVTMG
ncbi:MAG: glycoside hydrolase family 2 TIM barrel-domain containing protein [Candidatus Obscuribacterales bacterium]